MKNNKKESLIWRRLDNSAKIYPLSTGRRYSTVFRLSVLLKEDINPKILQDSLNETLEKYKSFKVRLKKGFFWHYLENNPKLPIVEEEKEYPCKYIEPSLNRGYLFKVTYFKNKINIDIFHALTDGNSGFIFFKEIIYTYLNKCYPKELANENKRIIKIEDNTEDSYVRNYNKNFSFNTVIKSAYKLRGKKLRLGAVSAIHEIINIEELKNETKKYDVTITQYLTAVLIYSIYQANYIKGNSKKSIKICIPVNLKKYFPSNTMSNFYSYIIIEADMRDKKLDTFEKILQFVKDEFVRQLQEEEVLKTMSGNVKFANNAIVKVVPLLLKIALVRMAYLKIRRNFTTTYSNIGRVGIIGNYKNYIDNFLMLIAPASYERIKCTSCTYEDKIEYTFTSILNDNKIEKYFYNFLKDRGIEIQVESNGVLDDIS